MLKRLKPLTLLLAAACVGAFAGNVRGEKLDPSETAARLDRVLKKEIASTSGTPDLAVPVGDEIFARRAFLDLIGELPSTRELTAFVLDPHADKRALLIERLLADERFGQNWARYWRDVILYHRADDRGMLAAPALESYLTAQFNQGASWRDIAASFVTATGDVKQNGSTALFLAQMGATEDIAAEVCRIFMGVQIQCAQCHDHPTDRWKRQQFHEVAAFFPRVEIKRVKSPQKSFEVASVNFQRGNKKKPNVRRSALEHYMSDLNDPASEGTLVHPRFFVTNHAIDESQTDLERRQIFANLMTAPSNPWFSKAMVNRLWAELVGEGFYEPIDDLGPDRECSAPQSMELLSTQFAANNYDVKWLFRTVTASEAYQRSSRSRRNPDEAAFAANCPQRLRADQLLNVLETALDLPIDAQPQGGRRKGGQLGSLRGPRGQFQQTFGYDPSEPRDELTGSIPQALLLMNSPAINRAIDARNANTALGKLLADTQDDEYVAVELYLRTLARQPQPAELKTALAYVRETGDRNVAFEDLLWALINSTEFLHRR